MFNSTKKNRKKNKILEFNSNLYNSLHRPLQTLYQCILKSFYYGPYQYLTTTTKHNNISTPLSQNDSLSRHRNVHKIKDHLV